MEVRQDVLSKIRHWCARAERSPEQVRRKLYQWGVSSDADGILRELAEEGYLDESRFACAFALDHVRIKGWGPFKVAAALRQQHGIKEELVARALGELPEADIQDAARRAVRKRRLGREDEEKAKTVGALMQKGFLLEVAKAAVEEEVTGTKFDDSW